MRVAYFSLFGANEARKLPLASFKYSHTHTYASTIIQSVLRALSLSLTLLLSTFVIAMRVAVVTRNIRVAFAFV